MMKSGDALRAFMREDNELFDEVMYRDSGHHRTKAALRAHEQCGARGVGLLMQALKGAAVRLFEYRVAARLSSVRALRSRISNCRRALSSLKEDATGIVIHVARASNRCAPEEEEAHAFIEQTISAAAAAEDAAADALRAASRLCDMLGDASSSDVKRTLKTLFVELALDQSFEKDEKLVAEIPTSGWAQFAIFTGLDGPPSTPEEYRKQVSGWRTRIRRTRERLRLDQLPRC